MPPVPAADLVARHQLLSAELAQALRELPELRTAALTAYSETYQRTNAGVTERREAAKIAAQHFESESLKLVGEIDALRVELTHVEFAAKYSSG